MNELSAAAQTPLAPAGRHRPRSQLAERHRRPREPGYGLGTCPSTPTLFLLVGLPGTGKTTVARALEVERGALRLSPDEWMLPLFGDSNPDGLRDVLEGRLLWVAHRALHGRLDVVVHFGLWGRQERAALADLARHTGAHCES